MLDNIAFTSSCSALIILFPQISSRFAIDVMLYSLTESKPFNCICTKHSFRLYPVMIFLLAVVVFLLLLGTLVSQQPGRHRPPRWLAAMPSRHRMYDQRRDGGNSLACRHTGTTHAVQPEGHVRQA